MQTGSSDISLILLFLVVVFVLLVALVRYPAQSLSVVGALSVIGGVIAFPFTPMIALAAPVAGITSGLVMIGLGAMLFELSAIRRALERPAAERSRDDAIAAGLENELAKERVAPPATPSAASLTISRRQRQEPTF